MANALRERLLNDVVNFTFRKISTGEERQARGTLCRELSEGLANYQFKNPQRPPLPNQITYWDLDQNGWRSCKIEQLISLN